MFIDLLALQKRLHVFPEVSVRFCGNILTLYDADVLTALFVGFIEAGKA